MPRDLKQLSDKELKNYHKKYLECKKSSSRMNDILEHGYSAKFAGHLVRLLLQAEDVLLNFDLDLQRNKDIVKSVRRGEWKLEDIDRWFHNKDAYIEKLKSESVLPKYPDKIKIKQLLINCLEHHYGSLSSVGDFSKESNAEKMISQIREIIS